MDKALIYQYICEIEKELLGVLAYNQFAGVIVSEIINEAIITLHELPGGLSTDEKTAKDLISRNIRKFFTPNNTAKIIDKFQNWDNRVCYGYRGKRPFDTKTMIEFKLATDLSLNQVKKLEATMLEAVESTALIKHSRNHSNVLKFMNLGWQKWAVVSSIVLFTLTAIILIFSPSKSSGHQAKKESMAGEYVYIDRRDILHTDRKCSRLNSQGMTCERRKRKDIRFYESELICPKCVSDKEYELLTGE